MRTTITLDDDLLATAARLTGITDRTPLLRESLKALISREASRRLALLGGSMPDIELTPRRRPEIDAQTQPAQRAPAKLVKKPTRSAAKVAPGKKTLSAV
jgi:Arc/MetJ family transcription regulator